MVFVLSNVQWHDTVITVDDSGKSKTTTGKIVGRWDSSEVRFQPTSVDGQPQPELVIRESTAPAGDRQSSNTQ